MKIPRRNFLATLLAPLLARFVRKLKVGERVFSDELVAQAYKPVLVRAFFLDDGTIYHVTGDRIIAVSKWHERPPVMRWTKAMDPEVWPREEKDQA